MLRQPAFGRHALAILFLMSVLRSDELRHQRHDTGMAGRDNRRRQKGVIAFGLVIVALARQAIGAGKLLRAKIFGAVQRHPNAPAQPLKALQPAALAQHVNGGVKTGLQMRRIYRIKPESGMERM
jgi:hypothetical protein